MKKLLIPALCLCAALSLAACSTSEEPAEEEKGRIEEFNHKTARDATNAIKRPLDKARGVQDMSRQRVKDLEQD